MVRIGLIVFVLCGGRQSAQAIEDTPESRTAAAERYLQVASLADMMTDVADRAAIMVPEAERARFKVALTKDLDLPTLTAAMKSSLIRFFTADELQAMAQFYGSPVGKSILRKFGMYMADVMPTIQTEVVRAASRAAEETRTPEAKPLAPPASASPTLHP